METGFAVTGFLGVILNLLLPEDPFDEDDQAFEARALGQLRASDGNPANGNDLNGSEDTAFEISKA